MKEKVLGALTGLFIGVGLLVAIPTAAQAATWSNYATGHYVPGTNKTSSSGKVYYNRGRIYGPGGGVGYSARFKVVVNKTKGKILESGTGDSGGWVNQQVSNPTSNTVARCQLVGPSSPAKGDFLCDVNK